MILVGVFMLSPRANLYPKTPLVSSLRALLCRLNSTRVLQWSVFPIMPSSLWGLVHFQNTYHSLWTAGMLSWVWRLLCTLKCKLKHPSHTSMSIFHFSLKGRSSRWSGYLRSLRSVDLPIFWACSSPQKRQSGVMHMMENELDDTLLWLRGTEVSRIWNKKNEKGQRLPVSFLSLMSRWCHWYIIPGCYWNLLSRMCVDNLATTWRSLPIGGGAQIGWFSLCIFPCFVQGVPSWYL